MFLSTTRMIFTEKIFRPLNFEEQIINFVLNPISAVWSTMRQRAAVDLRRHPVELDILQLKGLKEASFMDDEDEENAAKIIHSFVVINAALWGLWMALKAPAGISQAV